MSWTNFSSNLLARAIPVLLILVAGCAHIDRDARTIERRGAVIAFFPVENLTGKAAPLKEVEQSLKHALSSRGFSVLDEGALRLFMARHRIRNTSGIDVATAAALGTETGAGAVLITSVELYDETAPPKIALRSRLVSLSKEPEILWMGSAGLAGDDSPGLLELGMVEDPHLLLQKATGRLAGSLSARISGQRERTGGHSGFGPRMHYGPGVAGADRKSRVIVLPFFNKSGQKYGGDMMRLHFIEQLSKRTEFTVIEPGVVREALLRLRIILGDGPSLPDVSAVTTYIDADVIISGNVVHYRDYTGPAGSAQVEFTVQAVAPATRKVIWSSVSYRKGADKVILFDWGRVSTAHVLASRMTGAVADLMGKQ